MNAATNEIGQPSDVHVQVSSDVSHLTAPDDNSTKVTDAQSAVNQPSSPSQATCPVLPPPNTSTVGIVGAQVPTPISAFQQSSSGVLNTTTSVQESASAAGNLLPQVPDPVAGPSQGLPIVVKL